jgi:hypothetical protein
VDFEALLGEIVELLRRQGRVSYGALKRRFNLDDDYLQDLKDELIDAQRVVRDEDGKVLVWTSKEAKAEAENRGSGESGKRRIGEKGPCSSGSLTPYASRFTC